MGKKTTHTVEMTDQENYVAWLVLDRVFDNLSFDENDNEYKENHEDFILELTPAQYKALKSIVKKMI